MYSELDGSSVSLWMATAGSAPMLQPLREDTAAEVCIVGAGIAGLTTAYRLAKSGTTVVVLDERGLDGGQTARTTGHLCNALDDRYFELEKLHGQDGAKLAAQSHTAAIDAIESICLEEGIDCDFRRVDGYLVQGVGDLHAGVLDREYEAACRAGIEVERVPGAPEALAVFGDALRFPRQARFHALRYIQGLARAVERCGGRLHTARASAVHDGYEAGVSTFEGSRVRADAVVVATHVPFNDRVTIHTKQAAYRTYVIAMRVAENAVPDALLWDTLDPYHYVRIAREAGATWLIVGGEDRKSGQDDDQQARFVALESWARGNFPMAGETGYRWSGHIIEPVDSLAFIGRNPGSDDIFVVTGDSGNGLTHGTLAGLLLADLINGRDSLWRELYAPNRINAKSADEYLKENLNVAAQYRELLTGGGVDTTEQLQPGEAAVLRHGMTKVAAFRDHDGALHLNSALCPHLGCVVRWNAVENSWDCPCHGSRFDGRDGSRLNGPADRGLSPAHLDEPAMPPPRVETRKQPRAH